MIYYGRAGGDQQSDGEKLLGEFFRIHSGDTARARVSTSRSSSVVVGEVRQSVSETMPAHRHIATPDGGISPRWKNVHPTSVHVEPTGSFR